MIEVVRLAHELVELDSPTGEEGAVDQRLAALLEALGYHVQRQPAASQWFNVYATREPPPWCSPQRCCSRWPLPWQN